MERVWHTPYLPAPSSIVDPRRRDVRFGSIPARELHATALAARCAVRVGTRSCEVRSVRSSTDRAGEYRILPATADDEVGLPEVGVEVSAEVLETTGSPIRT